MRFDQHFLKGVLPDAAVPHSIYPNDISFAVDSRAVKQGDIFVALAGAKVDGHNYLNDALAQGAAGFLMAEAKKDLLLMLDQKQLQKKLVILVADPLQAFIKLACAWRDQFKYQVVGITGSVGKTSTKETLKANTGARMAHLFVASMSNQNTSVGIAMNIFQMRADHKVAIFEMGISKRGEMAELAKIARPTTAIITNIGHAHMEGLGFTCRYCQRKTCIFLIILMKAVLVLLMVISIIIQCWLCASGD